MGHEVPIRLLEIIEPLEGVLVTSREQVDEAELVVAVRMSKDRRQRESKTLVFSFPSEQCVEKFRDQLCEGFEDDDLLTPWYLVSYLAEPAGVYFSRSEGGEGSSGPAQPALSAWITKRDDE